LDQIQLSFLRQLVGCGDADHANLRTICSDDPHFRGGDFTVDPGFLFLSYAKTPKICCSQAERPFLAISLFRSDIKASRDICPRSSPLRERTATNCAATSLSPTTSWKGSFCRLCSRIL